MPASPARQLKLLCLAEPRPTVAVAESLTAGHLQSLIASVSGSSAYFLGGITTYTLDQKVRLLGVRRAPAARVNAVSAQVAAEMARGTLRLFGSDLALATTGYAEPSPTHNVRTPHAYWALAHRLPSRRVHVLTGHLTSPDRSRTQVQRHITTAVLSQLVTYLASLRSTSSAPSA